MNRWDSIETFVKVVENNSFSKTAAELGVSKSHVSRQINLLENRLNAQLLIRTTRKVTVTEVGRAFYLRCKDIVDSLENAEQAVIDLQEKPRGRLRLTVAGAFGEDFITPAAVAFMQLHPDLAIEMDFTNRVVDLVSEGYDLAIRAGTLKDSSLIARRIASRELIICAAPAYFAKHGKPDSIDSLANHNCLTGTLTTWRFRDGRRTFDLRVEGNWHSNNGRALLHAARSGLGLIQLPAFYVTDDITSGLLETALDQFKPIDSAIWAVYPPNRHLSAKVRLFVDFLAERFSGMAPYGSRHYTLATSAAGYDG